MSIPTLKYINIRDVAGCLDQMNVREKDFGFAKTELTDLHTSITMQWIIRRSKNVGCRVRTNRIVFVD